MSHASAFDAALWAQVLRTYRQTPPGDLPSRWTCLEAAHVVGQPAWRPHFQVHLLMLALAWEARSGPEVRGQLLRLLLVPLGHATGRLPLGNPGTSRVSAFQPMATTPEVEQVLAMCRRALGPERQRD